jgi:hypothetical protein
MKTKKKSATTPSSAKVAVLGVVLGAAMAASSSASAEAVACNEHTVPDYIAAETPKVKARCYDPMPNAPADAKLSFVIKYDAKGEVSSVTEKAANGSPPMLVSCVAGRLRTWTPPCGPQTREVDLEFKR